MRAGEVGLRRRCGGILSRPRSASVRTWSRPTWPGADAAAGCDLLLAIGSTLAVYPIVHVLLAVAHGHVSVIVNGSPTAMDDLADAVLTGLISELLPALDPDTLSGASTTCGGRPSPGRRTSPNWRSTCCSAWRLRSRCASSAVGRGTGCGCPGQGSCLSTSNPVPSVVHRGGGRSGRTPRSVLPSRRVAMGSSRSACISTTSVAPKSWRRQPSRRNGTVFDSAKLNPGMTAEAEQEVVLVTARRTTAVLVSASRGPGGVGQVEHEGGGSGRSPEAR